MVRGLTLRSRFCICFVLLVLDCTVVGDVCVRVLISCLKLPPFFHNLFVLIFGCNTKHAAPIPWAHVYFLLCKTGPKAAKNVSTTTCTTYRCWIRTYTYVDVQDAQLHHHFFGWHVAIGTADVTEKKACRVGIEIP
jgi:hypothetical protein